VYLYFDVVSNNDDDVSGKVDDNDDVVVVDIDNSVAYNLHQIYLLLLINYNNYFLIIILPG